MIAARTKEKAYTNPIFPPHVTYGLLLVVVIEFIVYLVSNGVLLALPMLWATVLVALFYLSYMAIAHHDALPLVYALLFLTTNLSLLFNYRDNLPIWVLFILILLVNSGIMWLLLHFGTHLPPAHHLAYSLISGFMIAQIITVFASLLHDWPIQFEVAAYITTVFSYFFWRYACLSVASVLNWRELVRTLAFIGILILIIILGYSKISV